MLILLLFWAYDLLFFLFFSPLFRQKDVLEGIKKALSEMKDFMLIWTDTYLFESGFVCRENEVDGASGNRSGPAHCCRK